MTGLASVILFLFGEKMEKNYNIELLEQSQSGEPIYQKIRITIEGGLTALICENRGLDEGLRFYRENDRPSDDSFFKKVELKNKG